MPKTALMRGVRSGVLAVLLIAAAPSSYAQSDPAAVERGNRLAYAAAQKCFVANGHAMGLRQRAGDAAKASASEVSARLSFDTAVKLGRVLGFSNEQVNQDFGLTQARELPLMVGDDSYFETTVATCKALGLM